MPRTSVSHRPVSQSFFNCPHVTSSTNGSPFGLGLYTMSLAALVTLECHAALALLTCVSNTLLLALSLANARRALFSVNSSHAFALSRQKLTSGSVTNSIRWSLNCFANSLALSGMRNCSCSSRARMNCTSTRFPVALKDSRLAMLDAERPPTPAARKSKRPP